MFANCNSRSKCKCKNNRSNSNNMAAAVKFATVFMPLCRLVRFGNAAHLHFSFYFTLFLLCFFRCCSQPSTRFVWEQIRWPKVGIIETAVKQHFKIAPPSLHLSSLYTYTHTHTHEHTYSHTPLEPRRERLFACDRNAFSQCTCLLRFSATSSMSICCVVLNFPDACEIPDGSRRRGL